jgi:predicted DCC family thiol-disulfide oxidoreductase YuxK
MKRLWRDWNVFWFKPQTGNVLGLYRIVLGLLTLYSFALFAKDATTFFSDAGVLTADTLAERTERDFHTILRWIGHPVGVLIALGALFAAGICFTLGFYSRVSSVLLYVLVASFHERNNLVLNGGDTVLRTMLFLFMFAPSGAALSVDALRRRMRRPEGEDPGPVLIRPWAQRMMQIQVAIIYLVTAYAKSRGALYHDGSAMYYVFGLVDFNIRGVEQLMNYPLAYSFLTYAVMFIEVSLPFLLWFRAARPYAVLLGLLAHGWIIVFMTIPVFGVLMLATYLPFFSEEEFALARARLLNWFGGRKRARVYFDGHCVNCRKVRAVLESMDVLGRMEPLDARDADLSDLPPELDRRVLLEEMVLVTPSGRVRMGFDAYRWLAARFPATAWTLPLWYLPGVAFVGRRIYRRMARGRTVLARCELDGACALEAQPRTPSGS